MTASIFMSATIKLFKGQCLNPCPCTALYSPRLLKAFLKSHVIYIYYLYYLSIVSSFNFIIHFKDVCCLLILSRWRPLHTLRKNIDLPCGIGCIHRFRFDRLNMVLTLDLIVYVICTWVLFRCFVLFDGFDICFNRSDVYFWLMVSYVYVFSTGV